MVNLKWCFNVKNGLEIVEPNGNMAISYLEMAKESLKMIKNSGESRIWTASTCYYTIYYSLYSVLMKIGIKCEIHSCSIKFMKEFLPNLYNKEDVKLIEDSFELRNSLQYYPGSLVDDKKLNSVKMKAVDFFAKTKEIHANLGEKEINEIRRMVEERSG